MQRVTWETNIYTMFQDVEDSDVLDFVAQINAIPGTFDVRVEMVD